MVLTTNKAKARKHSPHRLSSSEVRLRWAMIGFLAICLCGLSNGNLMNGWPIKLYSLRTLTGIPCPFCGMTRSLIALLHFNCYDAISFHLFGLIIFIAMIGLFLGMVIDLLSGKAWCLLGLRILQSTEVHKLIIMLFLAYYILRLYGLYGVGSYHEHLMNSLIGDLLLSKIDQL